MALVTVEKAAEIIKGHVSTIAEWVELGYLRLHRVEDESGVRHMVDSDELVKVAKAVGWVHAPEEPAVEGAAEPSSEVVVDAVTYSDFEPSQGASDLIPSGEEG